MCNSILVATFRVLITFQDGPVRKTEKRKSDRRVELPAPKKPKTKTNGIVEEEDSSSNSDSSSDDSSAESHWDEDESKSSSNAEQDDEPEEPSHKSKKKRKRTEEDDDLESRLLQKLADEKDSQARNDGKSSSSDEEEEDDQEDDASSEEEDAIPVHETLGKPEKNPEEEKALRTVFLGNVSTQAILSKSAKKTLMRHLSSFLEEISTPEKPHKLESLRFRSTAFDSKLPKKAAFMKKELMDATTHSTNAYAVYTSQLACREAAKRLNGTVVLDRHLRVDQVAHPSATDNKRCVFVGNLDFVDDDTKIREDAEDGKKKKSKSRPAGDVEEGLWREFSKVGTVESVRVIRDQKTRVGKGFAYVQFTDGNGVEKALLMNDKKFPPLLPRKIRVMRAKNIKKSDAPNGKRQPFKGNGKHVDRTKSGRAGALLGRAGAAHARKEDESQPKRQKVDDTTRKVVFEGERATSNDKRLGIRVGGKRKKTKAIPRRTSRSIGWRTKPPVAK
jgi:nucleolar protein 12